MVIKKKISILIPCYNEEESIPFLWEELRRLPEKVQGYDWEFLFVNDGSKDETLNILKKFRKEDSRLCYIDLSRNYGKEIAMAAGFDHVSGDCVIIMDADLQHPTSTIPEMISWWEKGFEDVYGKRISRGKESRIRRILTMGFYKFLCLTSPIEMPPNVSDFRLLDRKCIDAIMTLRETNRYTKGLYSWIGFRKKEISYVQQSRRRGKSSMNFSRLSKLGVDGITSFSTVPFQFMIIFGIFLSIISFIYMIWLLSQILMYGDTMKEFSTLVILILFFGGIQLLCFGILGQFIIRIYNESKKRPLYFTNEILI